MDHKSIIKQYMSNYSDPKKTEMASHLLCDALHEFQIEDKHKLHKLATEIHEIYDGPHYNEHFAKHDVHKMYHKDNDGITKTGEQLSIAQARTAHEKYSHKIDPTCNVWDVYVAINANYHDKCSLFKQWFPDSYEEKIVEDAITFYFHDEDGPKGKVWHYVQAMRTRN